MAHIKYVKGKDGKFKGSIGDGKTNVPTPGTSQAYTSSETKSSVALADTYDKYLALTMGSEPRLVEVRSVAELKRALAKPGVTMVSTKNNFRPESTGGVLEVMNARSRDVVTTLTTPDGHTRHDWILEYPTAEEFEANGDGTWTTKSMNRHRTYAIFASKNEADGYVNSHRDDLDQARVRATEQAEQTRRVEAEREATERATRQAEAKRIDENARAEYAKNPRKCDHTGCENPARYGVSSCQPCFDEYRRSSEKRESRRLRNKQHDRQSMATLFASEGWNQDEKVTLINKSGTAVKGVRLFHSNTGYGYLPPRKRTRGTHLEPSDWVITDSKGNIVHAGSETTEIHVKLLCDQNGYSVEEARAMVNLLRSER